jgi:type IV pilus assembly protein PilB
MNSQTKQDEILKILLDEKLISEETINKAKDKARISGKTTETVLMEDKIVNEEDFAKAKAKAFSLPYRNLTGENIDEKVIMIIPAEVAKNYNVICFEFDSSAKKIKVGIVEPTNFKAVEAINYLAKEENLETEFFLISEASFEISFKHYQTFNREISTALKSKKDSESEEIKLVEEGSSVNLEDATKSAPVIRIVSVIIRHAIDGKASDIHIEPLAHESRVRYRIDGILHTSLVLPKNIHLAVVARIKVMANLKLDETRIPQDGRIRVSINNLEIDLRVSVMPLLDSEKVVMRILNLSEKAPTLKSLGFEGASLEIIENNIKKTEGLFLITGPTGSGKSTTLFSILNNMNKEGINISTLEDPIEYFIEGANQSQIRPEIGYNFASGLRYLLRQDPNVIMLGEIRDTETAELAIHAGLTGHFVLSTLHTNDAIGGVSRLIDMGVEPFLLSSTLNTLLAQRLARKICPNCKVEAKVPEEVIVQIKEEIAKMPEGYVNEIIKDFDIKNIKVYKGAGCPHCGNTGYLGRSLVSEAIDINEQMKEMIIDKKLIKIEDIKKTQKFVTIKQDGVVKVLEGITTIEEVLRVMYD